MAFDPELLEAMPDSIVLSRYSGEDAHGNDQYTGSEKISANITISERRGTGGDHEGTFGPDVQLSGEIIVPASGIKPRDKITFLGYDRYVTDVTSHRDAPDQGYYVQTITFEEET